MAISVQTKSGNIYTYLRDSNEIVAGLQNEAISPIQFCDMERIAAFTNLHVFTLGLTTKCNLRCTYCCYSGSYRNVRSHGTMSMSSKDVDNVLDFINLYAVQKPVVISFYGGESLLEIERIKEFVEKAVQRWNDDVRFELSTNGTLLSVKCIEYFVKHNFTIFVSLDGSEGIHNRQRIYPNGKGSFQVIRKSLEYIYENYFEFFERNLHIMMTLADVAELPLIASEWNDDKLLRTKVPIRILPVAPNYSIGVDKENFEECMSRYLHILDFFEEHPGYGLLRVFFERFLAEWTDRPVISLNGRADIPTCVPDNSKLYIDTEGKIGICEKMPDVYRVGTLSSGVNFERINDIADRTANIIRSRCAECPVARLCDICPNVIDLSVDEMDIYCHNQKIIQEVKFRIFCEMAERGLL